MKYAKLKEKAAKLVFSESVMSKIIRAISEWRTILYAVLGSITIIILTDLILTFLFGSQLRLSAQSIFGSNDKQTLLSLLFIEGALIFGAGAACASAMSESKITVSSQGSGSASYKAEKLLSQRQEIRQREIATGILLILIGGPLLIIPLIFSII